MQLARLDRGLGIFLSAGWLRTVRQHQRRQAGIRRRRDPGIDAGFVRSNRRAKPEGRREPLVIIAGHERCRRHQSQQGERAQRHWVKAIGARRRMANFQAPNGAGETFAVRLPERLGLGIFRIGGQLVLVRRGRTMSYAGAPLDPAHGVFARWPRDTGRENQGRDGGCGKDGKEDRVESVRQRRPYATEGKHRENRDQTQQNPKSWPQPFKEQRPGAELNLAREFTLNGRLRGR